jgi:hypothetical protein
MAKQTLDELLEQATIGQLKHLAANPKSTYVCNTSTRTGRLVHDDDPAPLLTSKSNIKLFRWGQIKLLRKTGSKIVATKAFKVLKRRNP